MSNKVVLIIIALLIILGGGYYFMQKDDAKRTDNDDTMMMEKQDDVMEKDAMMEKDGDAMEGETMMKKDGDAMESDSMMKKDGDAMEKDTMMEKEGDAMEGETMMKDDQAKAGSYEAYTASKVSQAANGTVVLFFHASWCPTCRAADANINVNLSGIPAGTTILKTDYDSETALRQKYGVTTQHTFVQVDANGNLLKKWTGSATLSAILGQIS